MNKPVRGPAVELTVTVRYPMPRATALELADLGVTTVGELIASEITEMEADPAFFADLLESDRSHVTYAYELDDADDPFAGGEIHAELTDGSWDYSWSPGGDL